MQSSSLELNPRYGRNTGYFISDPPDSDFDPNTYWPFLGGTQIRNTDTLMVGPGSVTLEDNNNDGVPDGFVASPLRPIKNVTNSDQPPIGSYAYQSLGLPVNVQTGGFRRDLTAVMREMEDNLRNNTNNQDQIQSLFNFQQSRMQHWREQTEALEGRNRPSDMPRHRWIALNGMALT